MPLLIIVLLRSMMQVSIRWPAITNEAITNMTLVPICQTKGGLVVLDHVSILLALIYKTPLAKLGYPPDTVESQFYGNALYLSTSKWTIPKNRTIQLFSHIRVRDRLQAYDVIGPSRKGRVICAVLAKCSAISRIRRDHASCVNVQVVSVPSWETLIKSKRRLVLQNRPRTSQALPLTQFTSNQRALPLHPRSQIRTTNMAIALDCIYQVTNNCSLGRTG
jgi:hypothetical protein